MCGTCCTSAEPVADTPALARRGLLAGLGGVGLTLGLAACGQSAEAPAPTTTAHPVGSAKLELILLGTRAGPPPAADQAGISTALVVDGHTYLIDCGRGSVSQFAKAGLKFASIRSIFLTHLHIDHLADYYNYFVLGAANFAEPLGASGLVSVYGPGPAGGLPPKPGGGTAPTVATADPTPGTKAMTDNLNAAFAYSSNALMLAGGANPTAPIDVHEIAIPPIGADFTNRAPVMQPFPVMSDGTVTVSAILVPHGPVFPAFAFRFDTAYGSVTFSGDTTYTDNIPTLAKNTDVLVHEAINMEGTALSPELRNHSLESHVEVQKVGAIAQRSGARKLVLSHIADSRPGPLDARQWHAWAQQGYDGEVIVGADLQTIVVK